MTHNIRPFCPAVYAFVFLATLFVTHAAKAENRVRVESVTVDAGDDTTVGLFVSNDDPFIIFNIPLVARSLGGNAFWTAVDTLPFSIRGGGHPDDLHPFNRQQIDYTSPDQFLIAWLAAFVDGVPLPPGTDEPNSPSVRLSLTANMNPGVFELDTLVFPPTNTLQFVDQFAMGTTPEFTKGTVTVLNNTVHVESVEALPGSDVDIGIYVSNRESISSFIVPLVARTTDGGAFWTGVDTLPWSLRLQGTDTGIHSFNTDGVDLISPDPMLISYVDPWLGLGIQPGTDEVSVPSVNLRVSLNDIPGEMEIDTALYPPGFSLQFQDLSGQPIDPSFVKGTIVSQGNRVRVESVATTVGSTIDLGVYVTNIVPVSNLTVPLIARSVIGGAFWTAVDTLTFQVRGGGASGEVHYFDDDQIDFVSPDQFHLGWLYDVYGLIPIPPGTDEPNTPMFRLQVAINENIGQFELDTLLYPPQTTLSFFDEIGYPISDIAFTKGTVTVLDNAVSVESVDVSPGEDAEVGVYVSNEQTISSFVVPLIARNISGGAFWTDVDTLPWNLRVGATDMGIHTFNNSSTDWLSPDPLMVAYLEPFPGAGISAGTDEVTGPSVTLDIALNAIPGVMEIDTALFPPGNVLHFVDQSGIAISPKFSKGTITALDNRVRVDSVWTFPGQTVDLGIYLTNREPISNYVIPLIVRTVSGGAFWSAVSSLPFNPRSGTLGIGLYYDDLVDFNSPDQILLVRLDGEHKQSVWISVGTDEPHRPTNVLRITANAYSGTFELDTALYPPSGCLQLVHAYGYQLEAEFEKGYVTIGGCDCPDQGNLINSGSSASVIDVLDVIALINYVFRNGNEPYQDSGCGINRGEWVCDMTVNVLDVIRSIDYVFRSGEMPCHPCD